MTTRRLLTLYETRVDRRIAAWKRRRLPILWRLSGLVTRPIGWAVGCFIPDFAVRAMISGACSTSKWLTHPRGVLVSAGVERIEELRCKSLELSDRLAGRISRRTQLAAFVQGGGDGVGRTATGTA